MSNIKTIFEHETEYDYGVTLWVDISNDILEIALGGDSTNLDKDKAIQMAQAILKHYDHVVVNEMDITKDKQMHELADNLNVSFEDLMGEMAS